MAHLFDPGPALDPTPDPEAELSAGQKLTLRRRRMLAAGIHPATKVRVANADDYATLPGLRNADTGACCGRCVHAVPTGHATRIFWKCDLVPYTAGAATDIRVSWPACIRFEAANG